MMAAPRSAVYAPQMSQEGLTPLPTTLAGRRLPNAATGQMRGLGRRCSMSRRYGQVPLDLWNTPEFKSLTDQGKLAVLFFWCGPHSTSAGIGRVPDGYVINDLGWDVAKWRGARLEAEKAGFIRRDDSTETVLVTGYLKTNKPQNPRHRAAIVNQIASITCPALQQEAETALALVETPKPQAKALPPPQSIPDYLNTPHLTRGGAG